MKVKLTVFGKNGVKKKKTYYTSADPIESVIQISEISRVKATQSTVDSRGRDGPSTTNLDISNHDNNYVNDDYGETTYPDFSQPLFFEFPFSWIWNNSIMGVKLFANNFKSYNQLYIIQDFKLESQDKSENIVYDINFVCVVFKAVTISNQKKRIISSCSSISCNSSKHLIK
jgi:hypothetical protein